MAQAQGGNPPVTGQQEGDRINTVATAIPFLRINPDGRTGGLGEAGLATSPDAGALYHNVSKLAFVEQDMSLGLTYTPWLTRLVDDIFLAYLSGYKRIDDLSTIGVSIRYFSLGNIQFTDIVGTEAGNYSPNELAIDLGYSRKLSDRLSTGITLKYGRSDLATGQQVSSGSIVKAANVVAADISVYYQNPDATFLGNEATFSWGAAITNIGNKVSYTEDQTKDFIPINLGLGTAIDMQMDEYNSLMFTFDINKLMVPTPDPEDETQAHREKSLLSGMFGSFGDAPGGFSEEIQELMYSIGAEYWYNKRFAVRVGHFNEHALKGNRKYLTAGIGLKYSVFGLNFSYIIPASSQPSPLDNTLRFQLNFDFGEEG
ncbi:MAG: type IX secretion system outer membrane channel protein PorV [Chitinophagales bacterium]